MLNSLKVERKLAAIMFTDIEIIDSIGRREVRTLGTGDAFVFNDGKIIESSWNREENNRLRFYDENEDEILWNAGKTWVSVLYSENQLEIN